MKKNVNYGLVFLLFILVECTPKKPEQATKADKIQDSTKIIKPEEKFLSFEELVKKFKPQTTNKLEASDNERANYYADTSVYHFSYQDLTTLQCQKFYEELGYKWSKTDFPKSIRPYSYKYMKNGVLQLFFRGGGEGRSVYIATYINGTLVSFGLETLLSSFGDIGGLIDVRTKVINENLFFTVDKSYFLDKLMEHNEITTKIDQNGKITQTKKVIVKREFGK